MADERSTSERVRLWVDLPTPGAATAGALVISGWAFRRGGARIVEVEARVGSHRAAIPQGVHRPDVALALGEPHADWSGFEGTLVVEESATERADLLVVRATDESGDFAEVEVPVRVLPSGRPVIEVERSRWSGSRIDVEGWLIWPESVAPRSLALVLGEIRIAETTPNLSRPDVARRFPSFPHGACRGFRLSARSDAFAAAPGDENRLSIVCTDARARSLQHPISALGASPAGRSDQDRAVADRIEAAVALARDRTDLEPIVLDWGSGVSSESSGASLTLIRPPVANELELPYLDHTIDFVVTDGADTRRIAEARRVASVATIEGSAVRWRSAGDVGSEHPVATVVVPVDGREPNLDAFLRQLRETLPRESRAEILVVDDGSPDETSALLSRWRDEWPALRVLRAGETAGFARSCNHGAELAQGELLLFLGSEMLPQPGWLPPLVRLLRDDPTVGAVGGKILSADGTLREAGRLLLADGSESGFGLGDSFPGRPVYSFVRDVDACSSAFMAIRRVTFLELGGFGPRGAPADDPSADLGARVRKAGYRVRYQPASVVVDTASASSSADSGARSTHDGEGARRRTGGWSRDAPAPRRAAPQPLDLAALHRLSAPVDARRVLICAPGMPEFDRESGSRRVFHLVELLQESGWAVSYYADRPVDGQRYLRILQQRGVATYAGPDSIRAGDEYVDDVDELIANGRFDLAIFAFWSLAEKLLPAFRSRSPETRLIVDSIDLHYLREERAARAAADPEPAANAALRLDRKRRELDTYASADAVLTVSAQEAEIIAEAIDRAVPALCVPDMEELARTNRGFGDRSGLLFVGNFHHPPNLEGLDYLCAEVLPRLDPSLLAAHPLSVVGNGVNERVREAVAKVPRARIVGWVPSVVPYLEAALLSLVSLLHGAGTKRKLVQALMVGTPNVSTSIGAEGLGLEHERHVLIADSAPDFAEGIARVATDPVLWNRLAREGRRHIERTHGRRTVAACLAAAVESVMSPGSRTRGPRARERHTLRLL